MAIPDAFLVVAAIEPPAYSSLPQSSADIWTQILWLFGSGGLTGILIAFFTFWTERTKARKRKGIPEIEGDPAPLDLAPTVHLQGPIIQATQEIRDALAELRGTSERIQNMIEGQNAMLAHLRQERIDVAAFREFIVEHIRHAKHDGINAIHEASMAAQTADQQKQALIRQLHEKNEGELRDIKEMVTRLDERTRPKR